jgi:hypothetical protein
VHHAEVVAHRIGEPFGTLVLALAVTTIEAALVLFMMLGHGAGSATVARDAIFAAVMIICNGVLGLCLLVGGLRHVEQSFRVEGMGSGLAALATLSTLVLVTPTLTTSVQGGYTVSQLVFVAMSSLALWLVFVFIQTIRHRDYFLPATTREDETTHAAPPAAREAWHSFGLLLVALVGVVGLAKVLSPGIEHAVVALNAPHRRRRHSDRDDRAVAGDRGGAQGRQRQPTASEPESGHRLGDGLYRPDGPGRGRRRRAVRSAADPGARADGDRTAGADLPRGRHHARIRPDEHDAGGDSPHRLRGVPVPHARTMTTSVRAAGVDEDLCAPGPSVDDGCLHSPPVFRARLRHLGAEGRDSLAGQPWRGRLPVARFDRLDTRAPEREPHEVFAPDDATVEHLLDLNPWAYSVLGKVVDAFNATLDRYPLISLGTPDPYKPPR